MSFQYLFSVFQIIDPFVEVEVIGLPVDCFKEQTRVVDDNGKIICVLFVCFAFLWLKHPLSGKLFIRRQTDEIMCLL